MRAATLALLLLAGCDNSEDYVKRPPDQYRKVGTVLLTTSATLPAFCKAPAVACTAMPAASIYTLDPCAFRNEKYAETLCHEYAHALGHWPPDHPTGVQQ